MNVGVIPARYAATRLPGKPLADLHGMSMVERVWRAAIASPALHKVVIATDHEAVVAEAQRIGAEVVVTSANEPSGTDRCYAAIRSMGITPSVVINIQGDEPLLEAGVLTHLVDALHTSKAHVATPVTAIVNDADLQNPACVKVAMNSAGRALYFSRSPIPFLRDVAVPDWLSNGEYWKHIGIYAYTWSALQQHVQLPTSPLERAEQLEQLRLLEWGAHFVCVPTDVEFVSVDTPEDADRVRSILASR